MKVALQDSLCQWVKDRVGLSLDSRNFAPVELALQILAERQGVEVERYVEGLLRGQFAAQPFVDAVTTHESYFFRAREQMVALLDRLLPAWQRRYPGRTFRVLSLPCARGEEPASLLMLARERGITTLSVTAADVAANCLEEGRRGLYSAVALRRTDEHQRQRWFTPVGERYFQLDRAISGAVDFRQANLLTDVYSVLTPPYDAIFCENLLIYFDGPTIERALDTLESLLAPGGWLFLDQSEWHLGGSRFRMEDLGSAVVFSHRGTPPTERLSSGLRTLSAMSSPVRPATDPLPTPPRIEIAKPLPISSAKLFARPLTISSDDLLREADDHYQQKRMVEALAAYNKVLANYPNHRPARLGRAQVLADCGEDFEALEIAEALTREESSPEDGVLVEASALVAVLLHQRGLVPMAQSYLTQVARLAPRHPVLALLARRGNCD